jgi:site-specific DNA-methyltransferase (adenine-specific)
VEKGGAAMIDLLNVDCMEYMKGLEDNAFDLAIVDPPYGIGNWIPQNLAPKQKKLSKPVDWNDSPPNGNYFNEIKRTTKMQIIWGANYYNCFGPLGGAIIWDKGEGNPVFSRCEMASISSQKRVDYVHINWQAGFYRKQFGAQIHPCQKPTKLYQWLLKKYAKEGDRILDTHLGSGSSAIAAHYGGFDFVGCELDEDYFKASVKRFDSETSQMAMAL